MIQKGVKLLVSIAQIRGARGLLGWSQTALATAAGLSLPTVKRYEATGPAKVSDDAIAMIVSSLEAAGVIFVAENGDGPGVRLRKAAPTSGAVDHQIQALENDLASIPAGDEQSPEAALHTMDRAIAENDLVELRHKRKRIRKPHP